MREIGKLLSTLLGSGIVRPSTQVPWLKGCPGTSMSGVGSRTFHFPTPASLVVSAPLSRRPRGGLE